MINIVKNSKGYQSGYVFRINQKSGIETEFQLDNYTSAVFTKGSAYVYINSNVNADLNKMFEQLQKALDHMSLCGILNTTISIPIEHFLSWYICDSLYIVKIIEKSRLQSRIGSGHIPKLLAESYQEGFRFYRLAQTANDLYDSYRHLWLAFESLMSVLCPKIKKESEYQWYCRCIHITLEKTKDSELHDLVNFRSVEELTRSLYKDVRCSLFHSKSGKGLRLPFDIKEYERVKLSLRELTIIILAIIKEQYKIRTRKSRMNPDAFSKGFRNIYNGSKLLITKDKTEKTLESSVLDERIRNTTLYDSTLCTIKTGDYVELSLYCDISVKEIDSESIRRFSVVNGDKEMQVFTLDEDFSLDGISDLVYISKNGINFLERPKTYDFRI